NLNISADALTAMISSLLNGYQEYAAAHPEADYSHLGETFLAFLKTEDGRAILCENLKDILLENGDITVSTEQFQALFREIMEGYRIYIEEQGYTDPEAFDQYLMEYLQTDNAVQIQNTLTEENQKLSEEHEEQP